MRLRILFALYLISTVAAIGTPLAIQTVEMARRRMIPVNSEAPLEPAPAQLEAPRGQFQPIPACQAPDGVEYYKDYHFSSGSDINDRRTFVPDITVQFCAVSKDGTVYLVGSSDNQSWFRAYTRAGQLKWSMPRDEYCSPPALSRDGTAYFISMPRAGNTALTAVDAAGNVRWTLATGGFEWNPVSPAIGPDGTVYAYTGVQSAPEIIAVSPEGNKLWNTSVLSQVSQLVVSPDGTIVVNVPAGHVLAFDPQGHELWRFYSGAQVNNGGIAVAPDGTVYFSAGFLFALDKKGATKWTFKSERTYTTHDYFDGSPIVDEDGTIYVDSYYHLLYAVTPDGRKKWAVTSTSTSLPGLMLSSDGGLRTEWAWFAVSSGLATHGWPSPNGDAGNRRSQDTSEGGAMKKAQ
jgi:hypothetical protein